MLTPQNMTFMVKYHSALNNFWGKACHGRQANMADKHPSDVFPVFNITNKKLKVATHILPNINLTGRKRMNTTWLKYDEKGMTCKICT